MWKVFKLRSNKYQLRKTTVKVFGTFKYFLIADNYAEELNEKDPKSKTQWKVFKLRPKKYQLRKTTVHTTVTQFNTKQEAQQAAEHLNSYTKEC